MMEKVTDMEPQSVFNRCIFTAVTLCVGTVLFSLAEPWDTIMFGVSVFLIGAATGVGYAGGLFRKKADDTHAE